MLSRLVGSELAACSNSSATEWSVVSCSRTPSRNRYARESPTFTSASRSLSLFGSLMSAATVSVVPIPRRSQHGTAPVPDRLVRLLDGSEKTFDGRPASEGRLQCIYGCARRDVAARMTAHTVGHPVKRAALDRQVLVDGADASDVGGRTLTEGLSTVPRIDRAPAHRETSNTVPPTCTRSPRSTFAGAVSRSPVQPRTVRGAEVLDP